MSAECRVRASGHRVSCQLIDVSDSVTRIDLSQQRVCQSFSLPGTAYQLPSNSPATTEQTAVDDSFGPLLVSLCLDRQGVRHPAMHPDAKLQVPRSRCTVRCLRRIRTKPRSLCAGPEGALGAGVCPPPRGVEWRVLCGASIALSGLCCRSSCWRQLASQQWDLSSSARWLASDPRHLIAG